MTGDTRPTLVDTFLPIYDVSDAVATVVNADLPSTWRALMDVDLIDVGRQRPHPRRDARPAGSPYPRAAW